MIIKVNLLPRSFAEKKQVKIWTVICSLALVASLAFNIYSLKSLQKHQADLDTQLANMQALAQQVTDLDGKVSEITSTKIPAVKEKTQFVEEIDQCNAQWASLLEDLARYTYRKVTYTSISPTLANISIAAHTDSVSSVGRYLLGMLRSDRFTYVSIGEGQIPDYPRGGQASSNMPSPGGMGMMEAPALANTGIPEGGISFTVVCSLKTPLKTPAKLAGAAGGATGGAPGASPAPMVNEMPSGGPTPAGGGMVAPTP